MEVELLADIEAPEPADVVLFNPIDPSFVVVGTYLLDESTRQRTGKICTFKVLDHEGSTAPEKNSKRNANVSCDAILDMKW